MTSVRPISRSSHFQNGGKLKQCLPEFPELREHAMQMPGFVTITDIPGFQAIVGNGPGFLAYWEIVFPESPEVVRKYGTSRRIRPEPGRSNRKFGKVHQ